MKENKDLRKKTIFLSIVAFLFVLILTSYSFAYYYFTAKGVTENKIESCSLDMDIIDADSFDLVASYPIDDSEVENYDPYTITIRNNNSKCKNLQYYINANNYCDVCLLDNNNNCIVGEKAINCINDHTIDPQFIRYKITNKTTGKTVVGSNPEKMYIPGDFTSSNTNSYDIKMWISKDATNEDIYVYNNGQIVYDNDVPVVKSYVAKFETNITTEEVEHNLGEFNEKYFNVLEDGSYGNKYSLSVYSSEKYNLVDYVWKDKTRYNISYKVKGPVANKVLSLEIVYTDGTYSYDSKNLTGDWLEHSLTTANNKTVSYVCFVWYTASGTATQNVFMFKDLVITEVR